MKTQAKNAPDIPALNIAAADVREGSALPKPDPELGAMTITEFCTRYHINRVTLYKMRLDGTAPEVLMIGRKVLITYRAALEWEARMSAQSVPRARTA